MQLWRNWTQWSKWSGKFYDGKKHFQEKYLPCVGQLKNSSPHLSHKSTRQAILPEHVDVAKNNDTWIYHQYHVFDKLEQIRSNISSAKTVIFGCEARDLFSVPVRTHSHVLPDEYFCVTETALNLFTALFLEELALALKDEYVNMRWIIEWTKSVIFEG